MKKFICLFICILHFSLEAKSTQTDILLAKCLSQILYEKNLCQVILDLKQKSDLDLSNKLIEYMKNGETAQTILVDKKGARYNSWEDYKKNTAGKIFCQIWFVSKETLLY